MTLIEMLLVAAITASLIGLAVPFFGNIVQEAQDLKTRRTLRETRKLINLRAYGLQRQQSYVEGTPYSPLKAHRPEFETPVESLIPVHLALVPVDAYNEHIYRIGNYLVSNGFDRLAGTLDDIHLPMTAFRPEENPETGAVWSSPDELEARYQTGALALRLQRYMKEEPEPTTLFEMYEITNRASPRDPWAQDYILDTAGKRVVSTGPDRTEGTPDDIATPYGEIQSRSFRHEFTGGIHSWIKLFPVDQTSESGLRSTPVAFPPSLEDPPSFPPPGREVMRFQALTGSTAGTQQVYYLRLPPATFVPTVSPSIRADVEIWRNTTETSAVVGLFANYRGHGTGYRAWVQIEGTEAFAFLGEGIPRRTGKRLAPNDSALKKIGEGLAKNPRLSLRLEVLESHPPKVVMTVGGGGISSGTLEATLSRGLQPEGFMGLFTHSLEASARFDADFDNVEISN